MEQKGSVLMQRYELGRLLGQGTFANVYHARNLITGMSVAIKVVDKEKILKVGMIDQIKREISVMRLIRHPHVVELYEVMASKTKIYFVMEHTRLPHMTIYQLSSHHSPFCLSLPEKHRQGYHM